MAVPCSTMSLTELSDGLVDRHVVGNRVIIDQNLKFVTDALRLIYAVIYIVFVVGVVAIAALPLFDVIARRMPLQIALELVRVKEAQGRRSRSKVTTERAKYTNGSRQVVNSNGKLFQLVDTAAQLVRQS